MKNLSFRRRFRFARNGISGAFQREASFRTQVFCGIAAFTALVILRPAPIWWALIVLAIAAVLGAELLNTALESLADRLHPDQHPAIGFAKDCAAGAVLLFSLASVLIFLCLLIDGYLRHTSGAI
jgi:diacylglycerol kinase (ATP)